MLVFGDAQAPVPVSERGRRAATCRNFFFSPLLFTPGTLHTVRSFPISLNYSPFCPARRQRPPGLAARRPRALLPERGRRAAARWAPPLPLHRRRLAAAPPPGPRWKRAANGRGGAEAGRAGGSAAEAPASGRLRPAFGRGAAAMCRGGGCLVGEEGGVRLFVVWWFGFFYFYFCCGQGWSG